MSRRTTIHRSDEQHLALEMWALADNPDFQWFCRRAWLVDDYEPMYGTQALALAVHTAYALDPVTDEDFDRVDEVTASFAVEHTREPPLWRCDFERRFRQPLKLGLAGQYNSQILDALRASDALALIDASCFEYWQMDQLFALVPNDREFWAECRPPEHDWYWPTW